MYKFGHFFRCVCRGGRAPPALVLLMVSPDSQQLQPPASRSLTAAAAHPATAAHPAAPAAPSFTAPATAAAPFSPLLSEGDFEAKPSVLLLGQYSTGTSTFIKYLLGRDYPGIHIGPEPTTDRYMCGVVWVAGAGWGGRDAGVWG